MTSTSSVTRDVLACQGSPWEVLGLKNGAPLDQVKAAHRSLSGLLHPDRNPGDLGAAAAMAKVNAAYKTLKAEPRKQARLHKREECGTCGGKKVIKVQKGFKVLTRKCPDC